MGRYRGPMRRWFPMAMYGVGGFALAVLMVWGGFAVAGHRLSTPATPIEPYISAPSTTPSGPNDDGPTTSPSRQDDLASPSSASPSSHSSAEDHSGDGGDD